MVPVLKKSLSLNTATGFWQIPLDKDRQRLTTFITPYGRYRFERLPFRINSVPEIFQRKMVEMLEGLQVVAVYMDDIMVHGSNKKKHEEQLQRVTERLESAGLKLNPDKCLLRKEELHFLGQVINKDVMRPDPAKVSAIHALEQPENVQELNLSTVGQPLNGLPRSDSVWMWGRKQPLRKSKGSLHHHLPWCTMMSTRKYKVAADASSYEIGNVLLQLHGEGW